MVCHLNNSSNNSSSSNSSSKEKEDGNKTITLGGERRKRKRIDAEWRPSTAEHNDRLCRAMGLVLDRISRRLLGRQQQGIDQHPRRRQVGGRVTFWIAKVDVLKLLQQQQDICELHMLDKERGRALESMMR